MTNYDLPLGTHVIINRRDAKIIRRHRASYTVEFIDNKEVKEVYHGNIGFEQARYRLDTQKGS